MKVKEIAEQLDLSILCGDAFTDREVSGAYICDLLSWVMSHGAKDNMWITVQVHPNVVAVAVLLELSCIIIPENIDVEAVSIQKAESEGIPILRSKDNGYEICRKLSQLGI